VLYAAVLTRAHQRGRTADSRARAGAQQDITRGRDMVDSLFQGATGNSGTHNSILSSTDYLSNAARTLNNIEDGFYISPAFLDKLSIHVAKNFLDLPKIKVPLILGARARARPPHPRAWRPIYLQAAGLLEYASAPAAKGRHWHAATQHASAWSLLRLTVQAVTATPVLGHCIRAHL